MLLPVLQVCGQARELCALYLPLLSQIPSVQLVLKETPNLALKENLLLLNRLPFDNKLGDASEHLSTQQAAAVVAAVKTGQLQIKVSGLRFLLAAATSYAKAFASAFFHENIKPGPTEASAKSPAPRS